LPAFCSIIQPMNKEQLRIWAGLLTLYIVWGSTYLAIRFAVETLPPFTLAATRFLVAGVILYVWMRLTGLPNPTRRQWQVTTVMGTLLLLGGNGLVTWAEQYVVSGVAALLIGATPLWMVVVDGVRPGGRRPGWRTLAGVLLGLLGIALLISPASLGNIDQGVDPLGALALVLAALFWSIGSIYGREHHAELPTAPLMATSLQMLTGGLALLLVGGLRGEFPQLWQADVSLRSLLGLGYLIVFGSLVGYSAYTWLLGVAPTPLVATYAYVNPLVAVLLGWLLAGEPLTLRVLLAAGIIISAVVLINLAQTRVRRLEQH
jgi:drug/metabolite transporter (DMT)-like permease